MDGGSFLLGIICGMFIFVANAAIDYFTAKRELIKEQRKKLAQDKLDKTADVKKS